MTIRRVTQRYGADCAICCVAMATGARWIDAFMAAPITDMQDVMIGLTLRQVVTTFRRMGHNTKWHWPEGLSPNNMGVPLREKMRGKNAIHLVPSIHHEDTGTYHYVLVNDGVIYDPSPRWKRRYRRYDQLMPLGVIYQPQGN